MEQETLRVQMLGEFAIHLRDHGISDNDNRSHKIWLLLAYMIYCRNRPVSQQELTHLLWEREVSSSNPLNALKTMFHRVRTMLDQLDTRAGHNLILRKNGSYAWNTDLPLTLDAEEFEASCHTGTAAETEEEQLRCYLQALSLYQGDFLSKLSSESWVIPIAAYYHNLYLSTALKAIQLLEGRSRREEAVSLCRKALVFEPYREDLYLHLLQNLLQMGKREEVISVYEEMRDLLFSNFGVMPSEDLRALYREASRTVNSRTISMELLEEQLREPLSVSGAMVCDYDFFKVLYHAETRALLRSGNAIHISLLSVTAADGSALSKRSLDRAMENLLDLIRGNLRRGDIASRCSVSQYVLMLPQANYENSCRVSERVIQAFYRQYPHSPAKIHYSIQPLHPNT